MTTTSSTVSGSSTISRNWWPTVLAVGLLVGALDITAALISYSLKTHKDPVTVFYFIASAFFGKAAYSGGLPMILVGGLMHFLIAGTFALFFFLIYPRLRFLSYNIFLTAILYGAFIWAVMNLIMLPLLHMPAPHKTKDVIISMLILIVAIGLPLSFFAKRYYRRH